MRSTKTVLHPLTYVAEALLAHTTHMDENHFTCKSCFHPKRSDDSNSAEKHTFDGGGMDVRPGRHANRTRRPAKSRR